MTVRLVRVFVMLIIGLGFGLGVFQLGHDSFWNDEAGVALVAVEPTVTSALLAMRPHAMAMPLDCLIAWLVAKMGVQEFFLRFSSVIWGTLTLFYMQNVMGKEEIVPSIRLATWARLSSDILDFIGIKVPYTFGC